ncbi:hypothetical protein McanMca71_000950 [Microsporum canis]|uniref:Uncharacterized protein n=1 Tax=Arthroderma otae (strain ATCC MYA-4605 / CBS 113480) TaxID=554155 RepID=C5FI15_ARTOC|nr:conserved hypothetical protein [Microsporum canis CBS 113480]EEQ28995.1 conserved hypothetical protein [Microsporum canis CBS 113480]
MPFRVSWERLAETATSSERFFGDKNMLTNLFIIIRESGTAADLRMCLSVSKKWHNIAFELIYCILTVTEADIEYFLATAVKNPRRSLPIKSLTVLTKAIWPDTACPTGMLPQAISKQLRQLAKVIEIHIPMLESFSFHVDNSALQCPHPSWTSSDEMWPAFDAIGLALLLEKLPQTCRNVEIDTCGLEVVGNIHLCDSIARLIPNLVHLRLRLHSICPDFIPSAAQKTRRKKPIAPDLRSLIINFDIDTHDSTSTTRCPGDIATRIDVKQSLRRLLNDKDFPKIQRVEIYERVDDPGPALMKFDIMLSTPGAISRSARGIHEDEHPNRYNTMERSWWFTKCRARLVYPDGNSLQLTESLAARTLKLPWSIRHFLPADSGDEWREFTPGIDGEEFELVAPGVVLEEFEEIG